VFHFEQAAKLWHYYDAALERYRHKGAVALNAFKLKRLALHAGSVH
jgi:hypothetical protein